MLHSLHTKPLALRMQDVIISGADQHHYPLLFGLIRSLRQLNLHHCFDLVVLDAGFSDAQRAEITPLVHRTISLHFESAAQQSRFQNRRSLLINYHKARLNQLFPEYHTLIFLDADTWVQTPLAFTYLTQVAALNKLAIVSQASRMQNFHMTLKFHPFSSWWHRVEPRGILYKNGRRAQLPRAMLRNLVNRPVLNCGVFALQCDAPHWERWQHWQAICMRHGRIFTTDQLALGLAIYEDQMPYEALPDICNFFNPPVWRFDNSQKYFTDLYIPYTPVSIMHLAGIPNKLDPELKAQCIDEHGCLHMRGLHFEPQQVTAEDSH